METQLFTQFGVSGLALLVLWLTLKESHKRMKEQDAFMEKLIDNHFQHSIGSMEKLTEAITKLSEKIK